jgi:hypothetical protein
MLCGIADVYDAMRSQRSYQQAHPTDRIIAVLQRNDGTQFDQHLVRRFVQLLGIYPPGNLVRLSTGEIARRHAGARARSVSAARHALVDIAHRPGVLPDGIAPGWYTIGAASYDVLLGALCYFPILRRP